VKLPAHGLGPGAVLKVLRNIGESNMPKEFLLLLHSRPVKRCEGINRKLTTHLIRKVLHDPEVVIQIFEIERLRGNE
jgi:hypothetical protein